MHTLPQIEALAFLKRVSAEAKEVNIKLFNKFLEMHHVSPLRCFNLERYLPGI